MTSAASLFLSRQLAVPRDQPLRFAAVGLALIFTPALGFFYCRERRLAWLYLAEAMLVLAFLGGLNALDLPLLADMPYRYFYLLSVNVAGALHLAARPLKPLGGTSRSRHLRLALALGMGVGASLLLFGVGLVFPVTATPSLAMAPTIGPNRLFLVNRLPLAWHHPTRGSIVLYRSSRDRQLGPVIRLSRIIGIAGDRVAIAGGVPVVNGTPLAHSALDGCGGEGLPAHACYLETLADGSSHTLLQQQSPGTGGFDNRPAVTVPENAYFVLGDNRDQARDSRDGMHVGLPAQADIIGTVLPLQLPPATRQRLTGFFSGMGSVSDWMKKDG